MVGCIRVPFVPTPPPVVNAMLKIAKVSSDDILYDLGCGDGRIPIMAVELFNVKKAVCVEIRENLYHLIHQLLQRQGKGDR